MLYYIMNEKLITKIQKYVRNKLVFIKKINDEINFIYDTMFSITNRLNDSFQKNFITQDSYNSSMYSLEKILTNFQQFPEKVSFKALQSVSKYSIFIAISKIKLELINICRKCGSNNIFNIIKLILNTDIYDNGFRNNFSEKYLRLLYFYNNNFSPCSSDIFSVKTHSDFFSEKENIELPTCVKNTIFNASLIEKILGAKIYIPVNDTLIVLTGYFKDDPLNLSRIRGTFENKKELIIKELDNYDIPISFKKSYIEQISIRDFIIYDKDELCKKCYTAYNTLIKLKKETITYIVKEFLTSDIEKQREILTLFLLNKDDTDTQFLAYLMYDMISNESYLLKPQPLAEQVFNSLHWSVQKLFKIAFRKVESINNNLMNFNEEKIPYDKRIYLMKASDRIKSKAYDKLKEINASKGESNAKAQQYLDGILKIPFGIYKKESIMIFLESYLKKYEIFLKLIKKYIDSLEKENYNEEIMVKINAIRIIIYENTKNKKKTSYSIHRLIESVHKITDKLELENNEAQDKYIEFQKKNLKSLTIPKLKSLLSKNKMKKSGKKSVLIDRLLPIYNSLDWESENLKNFKFSMEEGIYKLYKNENYKLFLDNYQLNREIWEDYLRKRKQYLEFVEETLDKATYGMKDAKKQIKRVIAQWINGNDTGYVFGFEGPPGTGKTTLAKQGIAHAIKDEEGNSRPFGFITLGGSSNGSTLEGHNYTYVGSTWGKIVDTIMETKCMNPIIYIDELDKVSRTEHGKEIIGILTHLTDPSQNTEFADKYFSGIPIDISKCLIIFSYNDPGLIDSILLDRIHRVKTKSLSRYEKVSISNDFILPEILNSVGYDKNDIVIGNNELLYIIDNYTNESGVRKLKEKLFEIIREVNLKYLLGEKVGFPITIDEETIKELFSNKPKVHIKKIASTPLVGLVNGLYATSTGLGGITIIEAYTYLSEGRLSLELTGQQGDVMKESMSVAKTVAWNLLSPLMKNQIRTEKPFGIHIHCPEAATPKDGPSAGAAITLAIYSLLNKIPVSNLYAITGEIDLNGQIHPIGGLSSKIEGAKNAGVKIVLCPKDNEEDLKKIRAGENPPENENFKVQTVSSIEEVMKLMLVNYDKTVDLYNIGHLSEYIVQNISDIVSIHELSEEGTYLYVSPSCYEYLGWTKDELIGKSGTFLLDDESIEKMTKIQGAVLKYNQKPKFYRKCKTKLKKKKKNITDEQEFVSGEATITINNKNVIISFRPEQINTPLMIEMNE